MAKNILNHHAIIELQHKEIRNLLSCILILSHIIVIYLTTELIIYRYLIGRIMNICRQCSFCVKATQYDKYMCAFSIVNVY